MVCVSKLNFEHVMGMHGREGHALPTPQHPVSTYQGGENSLVAVSRPTAWFANQGLTVLTSSSP